MRDINVSEGIVPLGEFKTKASKIIRDIADSDEPLVITQNGRPAAVLMSPAAFQELRERHEFYKAVAEGVADSEVARVVDHKKVRRWIESWGTDRERLGTARGRPVPDTVEQEDWVKSLEPEMSGVLPATR